MAYVTKSALAQEGPIFFTPPPTKLDKRLWGGGSTKTHLLSGGLVPPSKLTDPINKAVGLGGGGSSATVPDPYAVADAQAQANIKSAQTEAEINRPNSSTPFGSTTWTRDPNNPNSWAQSVKLDPRAQAMLDQFYSSAGSSKPFDPSSLPAVSSADLSGYQKGIGDSVSHIMSSPTGVANNSGDIARTRGLAQGAGDVLTQLMNQAKNTYGQAIDYSSLGDLPQANEETRQKIQDALYANSQRTLDPYWQQQQSDMASQLAAQGITLGGDAYSRATGDFSRDRNDAYSQARNLATTGSMDEMQDLFAMEMARRQQGVGEINYKYNLPMELMGKGQGVYSGLESSLNQDYATNISQRQADQAIKSSQISDTLGTFGTLANMTGSQHDMTSADRTNRVNENLAASNDRNLMLQQLMQMAGGSTANPGASVSVGQTPLAQSIYNSYQGQLADANANTQSKNALMGTAGSLVGAGLMAF